MTTVKFDHSVKYNGVRHPAHEAFAVDDGDVSELKAEGAIVLSAPKAPEVQEPAPDEVEEPDEGEDIQEIKESLVEYTVAELTEFAKDRGIDLQGKTRKADIYNIIVASLN